MKPVHSIMLTKDETIRRAMELIQASNMQIAVVVDAKDGLLGTITDGDIRRALLDDFTLDDPVSVIPLKVPTVAYQNQTREEMINLALAKDIRHLPVLDESGSVVGIETLDDFLRTEHKEVAVVLMAGGLGSRLMPLTKTTPKPMLKLGSKPILQTIIENYASYGFVNFHLCLNYKAEQIKDHFGDGSNYGVKINYVLEQQKAGTAGALSLLKGKLKSSFFVMNGDLLTNVNFEHLLNYHNRTNSIATMAVKEHDVQVPYGVINVEQNRIRSLDEKPVHSFFVNTGIYCLRPEAINWVPEDRYMDMTDLFSSLISDGQRVCSYQMKDFWLDIGSKKDFDNAQEQFRKAFNA
ncbi:alcohol dehydrogenase [bacterium J17]|nr:alcohol dehydrogenase [bacterium J17]